MLILGFDEDFCEEDLFKCRGDLAHMFYKQVHHSPNRGFDDHSELVAILIETFNLRFHPEPSFSEMYPNLKGKLI